MARLSYRSNFRNCGSALRTASAVRSGSWVGIVAMETTSSGILGGLPRGVLPSKANSTYNKAFTNETISLGKLEVPSSDMRLITATLVCRTRARSISACAAARACSRMMLSLLLPAIERTSPSSRFASAGFAIELKVRPWR